MELLATLSVVFIFLLISIHLYARYRRRDDSVTITIRRRRSSPAAAAPPEGLDAAAIAALPRFIFKRTGSSPSNGREECPVCLCAAEEGEVMRLLPDCQHMFHIQCVDMWLRSHSTCPVCRTKARPDKQMIEFGGLLAAPPMPERFCDGGSRRLVAGGPSSSLVSTTTGNGSRSWLTIVDNIGAVDLERQ
ncbi:RING-H2 finger protein ATL40 [Platanthera zijinensis]|uniref:RING-type E3 ubiquitin transferase n=1 Tax=Platanthera zijinensis TaxID=2320716 RepID=A0AAP0BDI6_9ASPA